MLRTYKSFRGFKLGAVDGDVGSVKDLLFDDHEWTVRYLVADTGRWLPGRRTLISPESLSEPDWSTAILHTNLTREQIENGPLVEEDEPVSRRREKDLAAYFGWSSYWAPLGGPAGTVLPAQGPAAAAPSEQTTQVTSEADEGDPNLRSANEVIGYHIRGSDGEIGHIEDFVVNSETWNIQYIAVDTRNWLPGKKVLLAPAWIEGVSWDEKVVRFDLTQEAIKNGPEFDPSQPVNRAYEERLYDFHGRPVYWA